MLGFVFVKSRQHTSFISFFFLPKTFQEGRGFGTQLCLTNLSNSFLFQIVTADCCHFTVTRCNRRRITGVLRGGSPVSSFWLVFFFLQCAQLGDVRMSSSDISLSHDICHMPDAVIIIC